MRIVITGGFGFLGRQVAEELLERRTFDGRPVDRLVLADRFVGAVPSDNARSQAATSDGRTSVTGVRPQRGSTNTRQSRSSVA